jgi:energy-coupling factor transporter ATP-binding protein EcfA2
MVKGVKMENGSYKIYDNKLVLRTRNRLCDNVEQLITSGLFLDLLGKFVRHLFRQQSRLLRVFFNEEKVTPEELITMQKTLLLLSKLPADQVSKIIPESKTFFDDMDLLSYFIEQFYNFWRHLQRLVVIDSIDDRLDKRPYRAFTETVEKLMHVVRSAQRDILENVSGVHPRVYRQVSAGVNIAAITLPYKIPFMCNYSEKLCDILMTRQVLIYPPLIFNTPTNKRSGKFKRVDFNPIDHLEIDNEEWLCYPAKVGDLIILVYFTVQWFELGFALSNLFELADDKDMKKKPDAIYFYGIPVEGERDPEVTETIFYEDVENNILIGTVPFRNEYAYFGYLKKMILTLHNVKKMKEGRMPFHGAMFHIVLRDAGISNVLLIGDSGAGKSETLEALRGIVEDQVEDLVIIADDMGSIDILPDGRIMGYGTEIGAFVRMDDLQKDYAFGQIDRSIIMNPDKVNARVVLPVTKFKNVIEGFEIDFVLYANNYDEVDEDHPAVERIKTPEHAIEIFRSGAVMSKGTTTTTGLTHSYFANIFGPPEYRDLHDEIARRYFQTFFDKEVFVGEIRTQLGVSGKEFSGPENSAKALLEILKQRPKTS